MTKNDVLYFETLERQRLESQREQDKARADIPHIAAGIEAALLRANSLINSTEIEFTRLTRIEFSRNPLERTQYTFIKELEDEGLFFELVDALRAKGYGVWVDTGISGLFWGMTVSL